MFLMLNNCKMHINFHYSTKVQCKSTNISLKSFEKLKKERLFADIITKMTTFAYEMY